MSKATKEEQEHMNKVAELGCIACRQNDFYGTPASIHHARLYAGMRRDHMKVIPLCHAHHQGGPISRHDHNIGEFVVIYGTDSDLLDKVDKLLVSSKY